MIAFLKRLFFGEPLTFGYYGDCVDCGPFRVERQLYPGETTDPPNGVVVPCPNCAQKTGAFVAWSDIGNSIADRLHGEPRDFEERVAS